MLLLKFRRFLNIYNIFNLFCFTLTVYLSVDVILDFAFVKSTSTSQEQIDFDQETSPDIVICSDPPINENTAQEYGYKGATADYFWGWSAADEFIGWNGIDGKHNSTHILNNIFNLQLESRLISSFGYLEKAHWKYDYNPQVQLRTLRAPHGKCLVVRPPINETSFISLVLNKTSLPKQNEGSMLLNIFLMDPINSPRVFPSNFQMIGSSIKIEIQKDRYWEFASKVVRLSHLQYDPNFDCTEYEMENTYGDCVIKELQDIFKHQLGCIPPLLTSANTESQICNSRFYVSSEKRDEIRNFLADHWSFKSLQCKRPCTETTYFVSSTLTMKQDHPEIGINFDPFVDVTRSKFTSSVMTVFSSIGGSVRNKI